jgi:hypothetical protein
MSRLKYQEIHASHRHVDRLRSVKTLTTIRHALAYRAILGHHLIADQSVSVTASALAQRLASGKNAATLVLVFVEQTRNVASLAIQPCVSVLWVLLVTHSDSVLQSEVKTFSN